jgi:hypothetical protein
MAVSAIGSVTEDDKDPWPEPPASPASYPLGHWSTHVAALEPSGSGSPGWTPVVTVLTPDHT